MAPLTRTIAASRHTARETAMRNAHRLAWGIVLLAGSTTGLASFHAAAYDPAKNDTIVLFNGKDLSNWTIYVDPKTKGYAPESSSNPESVFKVDDGAIHVSGE